MHVTVNIAPATVAHRGVARARRGRVVSSTKMPARVQPLSTTLSASDAARRGAWITARARASNLAPSPSSAPLTSEAYFAAFARCVPPKLAVATLGGFVATAFALMFGCLLSLRELVRACREATLASRAVRNCANSIEVSCASVDRCTGNIDATCGNVDGFLEQANTIGTTTSNILTEAGLLQRRVSDLPNTLLGALNLADEPPPPRSMLAARGGKDEDANQLALRDIVLGKEITGRRLGNGWIGNTMHRFFFSRDNVFNVGEYVAVKRSNNTYTWGVVEMTDGDDANVGVDGTTENGEDFEFETPACEWPPRDLAAEEEAKRRAEANEITAGKMFKALIRMPLPKSLGEPERQYRVVVEVDRDLYRFKYVDASLLGKRY